MASLAASKKGHKVGMIQGSVSQMGGAIVVDPNGRILYRHVAETTFDHASIDTMLSYCSKDAGAAPVALSSSSTTGSSSSSSDAVCTST